MPMEKPAYGQPCNSCGLCCENELCPLAQFVFPRAQAPCPALESDGDRRVCGLVANPVRYAPVRTSVNGADSMRAAGLLGIGAGIGCDARLFGEEISPPPDFLRALQDAKRTTNAERKNILRMWANAR